MNITYQWWGFRIRFTHAETDSILLALAGGTASVSTILKLLGVPAFVIAIVAAAIGLAALWIKACDDGNGVAIYCAWWTGWFWVENPATAA